MDALRRILGQLLLRPTSRTSFSNVQQTLPYIPYSRFAYMYEIHQDLEQTHPIPSLRNIPSSAFFRIHQGADKYGAQSFEVVQFIPPNRFSIAKEPNYENATRLSSITPPIEGRDLVKEQIAVVGKQDEAVLEADEVDSAYAAILKDVTGINFRALVDQWNKNGLMETDIDAVSNRIPTGLGTTPTPTSSISISLSDSSRTEAETSDIQTTAETDIDAVSNRVPTDLGTTPTPTSSISISLSDSSRAEAETSDIQTAAVNRSTPNPTPTTCISLCEASNTEAGASAASECNNGDATKAPPPSLKSSSPIDNYCSSLNENAGLENNAILEVDSTSTSSVHLHLCGSSATEAADLDVHEFAETSNCNTADCLSRPVIPQTLASPSSRNRVIVSALTLLWGTRWTQSRSTVGKKNEALLEAGEADSPYAAILEDVAGINFRALVDQWNKNGLMVYTRLRSTPSPKSSVSISLDEASTTDAETSEIHSAACLRTTLNPTPTMSISLGEASNTEKQTSTIHTIAASECNNGDATKAPPAITEFVIIDRQLL
nr:unnamed protein product [Spirometra erinaceieuropaei]